MNFRSKTLKTSATQLPRLIRIMMLPAVALSFWVSSTERLSAQLFIPPKDVDKVEVHFRNPAKLGASRAFVEITLGGHSLTRIGPNQAIEYNPSHNYWRGGANPLIERIWNPNLTDDGELKALAWRTTMVVNQAKINNQPLRLSVTQDGKPAFKRNIYDLVTPSTQIQITDPAKFRVELKDSGVWRHNADHCTRFISLSYDGLEFATIGSTSESLYYAAWKSMNDPNGERNLEQVATILERKALKAVLSGSEMQIDLRSDVLGPDTIQDWNRTHPNLPQRSLGDFLVITPAAGRSNLAVPRALQKSCMPLP